MRQVKIVGAVEQHGASFGEALPYVLRHAHAKGSLDIAAFQLFPERVDGTRY